MIINNNLSALNTWNSIKKKNNKRDKNIESLSTGLRINHAADDAAGLAISEKIRALMRGLRQAERNIQDGISLLQTAEGGLACILDPPLQRMRELAIQAANDTLTDNDRTKIQEEVDQLKQSIDYIANNTEFNGKKLLCPKENLIDKFQLNYTEQKISTDGTDFAEIMLSPDGEKTLFIDGGGSGQLWRMDKDGTNLVKLTPFTATIVESKFSDDGSKIFTKESSGQYYQIDADMSGAMGNYDATKQVLAYDPFSSDGKEYYYNIGDSELYRRNVDGSNIEQLTSLAGTEAIIDFSPDGTKILYENYSTNHIHVMSLDGSNNIDLGIGGGSTGVYEGASFSPDGSKVVFSSSDGNIYSINVDGSGIQQLTNNALDEERPIYSPDGSRIAYSAFDSAENKWKVFIMNNDGTKQTEVHVENTDVTDASTLYVKVKWSHDGENLLISPRINPGESRLYFGDLGLEDNLDSADVCDFQVGAKAGDNILINLSDARIEQIGINDVDVLTRYSAELAIMKLDNAIQKVATERSKYGSYQNRLEHTLNNVSNYNENLTAAESRISGVDIAKAMMEQVKNDILLQASQIILAQANSKPEAILSILK